MTRTLRNSSGFTLLEMVLALSIVGIIVALALGGVRLGIMTQEAGRRKVDTLQRMRIIAEQLSQKIKSNYPVYYGQGNQTSANTGAGVGTAPATTGQTQSSKVLAFEGNPDSIRFVTFAEPLTSTGESPGTHEVRFYLGNHPVTNERGIIMMERDISDGDVFSEDRLGSKKTKHFLLAGNVTYLKFRYYQMKKLKPEDPGSEESKIPQYTGEWVDSVTVGAGGDINPTSNDPTSKEESADLNFEKTNKMTLPRAVEITIGIAQTQQDLEEEAVTEISPPIIALLHAGMKIAIPVKTKENAPT